MVDSRFASPCKSRSLACYGIAAAMSGCALQSPYSPPPTEMPERWVKMQAASGPAVLGHSFPDRWWTALHDPAIDTLVAVALRDSPTVDELAAKADEARGLLGGVGAQRLLSIQANASVARQQGAAREPGEAELSSAASVGLGVSYEVDAFGRVRESVRAAAHRLAARTAEVQSARLTLVAQVAEGVVALRACEFSRRVRAIDIESRTQVLDLTRQRVAAGVDAQIEESRSRSSLAAARTESALLEERCQRRTLALSALTGIDSDDVRSTVLDDDSPDAEAPFMPVAPELPTLLPAGVLAEHPALVAADREAAAAWSDVGAARAARLPHIDLGAVLTGNWLRAAGSTADFGTWSFGPTLVASLFDGGNGASNVDAADARYRAAVARLRQAVRVVVQNVEQALAFAAASRLRLSSSEEALAAARDAFRVIERRWRAGVTSLFELEDARRQRVIAEDAAIAATRDHAQAWIAVNESLGASTPAP